MTNRLADVDLVVTVATIPDIGAEGLRAVGMNKKDALKLLRKMWREHNSWHSRKLPLDRVRFYRDKIGNLFHEEAV
jgi:hypothetical protein